MDGNALLKEDRLGPFSDKPDLDEIAHAFFRSFARLEYALKAAGYLKERDGPAEPDWSSLADEIDGEFQQLSASRPHLNEAVDYLLKHPPMKQFAEGGTLCWRVSVPNAASQTDLVLAYVKRVRNNLFHGGKFSRHWLDAKRSRELLPKCLTVPEACLDASPRLRQAYES